MDPDLSRFRIFWRRFAANFIDGLILTPVGLFSGVAAWGPDWLLITALVVTAPLSAAYLAIGHGKYGQTIGKYAMSIEVVRAKDEAPVGYGRAFRRELGTLLVGAITAALFIHVVTEGHGEVFRQFRTFKFDTSDSELTAQDYLNQLGYRALPWTYWVGMVLAWAWYLVEILTIFTNPRRRAIHDFIGGTVVRRVQPTPSVAQPPPPLAAPG